MFALVGLDKDLLDALGDSVKGIFDPKVTGTVLGIPVIGGDEDWPAYKAEHPDVSAILGVDPPMLRARLASFYGKDVLATYIADHADVSPHTRIGNAVVVQRRAYISAGVHLGEGARINVGAQIHHDCSVGKYATIAPAAALMGSVVIGPHSYVGAGAVILQGISVGDGATVGAGAVVTEPVPAGKTVVGIPAKQIQGKKL